MKTVDWVVIVVIVVAVAIGGYFLYQNAIKYMIWPEKPPTKWRWPARPPTPLVVAPPVPPPVSRIPSRSSFGELYGANWGEDLLL